jgi:hypothetical protein
MAHQNGLVIAKHGPLTNQDAHDRAHLQDFSRHERTILIPVYPGSHDGFRLEHADP